ncbi:MAG: D-alanyl-D-alanine carboxypeptidase/D-alanyl-D-alanine-endopeptidase [Phycisphaerales bacterium]
MKPGRICTLLAAVIAAGLFTNPALAEKPRAARPQAAPAVARAGVADSVASAIAASGLRRSDIAVSIREVETGRVLADVAGDQPMIPASNMKLLTTAAALQMLGPDFRFRTRLLRDGDRLVVVGDGDPAFGDPALLEQVVYTDAKGNRQHGMSVDALVETWAAAVRAAGVTSLREVVVDDRIFDRQYTHPEWPANQLANAYCAEIAGLNFHTNLLHAYLGTSGGRAEITRWAPAAPWLRVVNKSTARTDKKAAQSIWVGRTEDEETFTLNGNLRGASAEPVAVCVHDMPAFFARLLAERLRAAGVTVANARSAGETDPKPTGTPVGPVVESPLATVVQRCNTDSQNLYAESLLKRIGAAATGQPGGWGNGSAALAAAIDSRLGPGTAARSLTAVDGSGLSRGNKVTANLLTAWLRGIAHDPALREPFLESLAVAGETGTVKKRFNDLDAGLVSVRCKTGYINGVSCLSGYIGRPGQPPKYAFSVLCNDLTGDQDGVGKAKRLQERIVKELSGAL